jgi:hypothetical protein
MVQQMVVMWVRWLVVSLENYLADHWVQRTVDQLDYPMGEMMGALLVAHLE